MHVMSSPFSDLHVIDLSDGVAGQYTGKIFAGIGATVTLVERPGGTSTRSLPPFKTMEAGGRWSLLFEHLNAAKRSFEHADESSAGELAALVEGADVVIRDTGSIQIANVPPTAIDCRIRDFPAEGAYAHWRATEMIHYALSGTMYVTGDEGERPLYGVGHRAAYAAGTTAYVSAMAALWERRRSGMGQRVDTTVFESVAAMSENLVSLYSYSKDQPRRRPVDFLAMIECSDGWLMLYALTWWHWLCEVFEIPDLADDERFVDLYARLTNWDAAVEALSEAALRLPVDEVVARCHGYKIIAERASTVAALVESEPWRTRGMTVTLDGADPSGRDASPVTHTLGPLFRVNGDGWTRRAAPVLGGGIESTDGFDASAALDATAATQPTAATSGEGLPLEGLRVVDLTSAWSGPFATRALSFLGAEVIKVEPPTHVDPWRGMFLPELGPMFPGWVAGENRLNRCVWFNTQAHDKRSFSLDILAPGGDEVFFDLLARADVLVANFTAGVLDRLGFGYDVLAERFPELVMVEMPAFGLGTTSAGHLAMGSTMEAATGMTALIGYGDGRPHQTGSTIVDPIGGLHGAAAVLTGLHQKARTGRSCHIEVAQVEAASHWIGEYVLAELEGEPVPPAEGNAVPGAEPNDAYRCSGHDEWVAISVPDETAWRGLCATLGNPALADDERFADPDARRAHRAELAELISFWAGRLRKLDAASRLQANGVPAAPVNKAVDIFYDATLRENGFMVDLDHPDAGLQTYPSVAYRLSRTPGAIRRRAPRFGEDNQSILEDLLGYDTGRIAELHETRAVWEEPYNSKEWNPDG